MTTPRSRLLVTCCGCGRDARVTFDVPDANFCGECCPGAQGGAPTRGYVIKEDPGPHVKRALFGRHRKPGESPP